MFSKVTFLMIGLSLVSIKGAYATPAGCWVTDAHGAKIIRVTPGGAEKYTVTGFNYPVTAVIDPRNNDLWVGDTGTGKLTKLNKNGSIIKRVEVGYPVRIGIDPRDGAVWAANRSLNEIAKVSANGNVLFRVGDIGRPYFVAVDPRDGSCWTCDTLRREIIKVDASGSIVFIRKKEDDYVCWNGVVDPRTSQCIMYKLPYMGTRCQIVKFDPQGNEIWRYPDAAGWLPEGYGLTVNPNDGSIWVGETYYFRVTKLTAGGKLLFHVPNLKFQPWAFSVCLGDNSVYVVGHGDIGGKTNFARLAANGAKIVAEKHIAYGAALGVGAYSGEVNIEPVSLGKIKTLFK
jgi:streptogramin lyase